MKTSNFRISGLKGNSISIANWAPLWFQGRKYEKLAPEGIAKLKNDPTEYTRVYRETVLGQLSPRKVYKELGEDAILLCWEEPGKFCHRRLVAEWLGKALGIEIPEVKK